MSRSARLALIDRALRDAPAHELAETLAAAVEEHFGAVASELYLVDLRLVLLSPVLDRDSGAVSVVGTETGQAFRDQRPVVRALDDAVALNLPMTLRGEPVGVLVVVLPVEADEQDVVELELVAQSAAHAVLLADVATDRYRRVRRPRALTLAAEMQWQLLPVRVVRDPRFQLAGQLEPAYAVRGDNFDWSQDGDTLTVAVTNGMGESVDASMLTTLAITALRNARRGGADVVDQAMLADQAIWAQYGGDRYVSTLLIELDLRTGLARVIDAGSPQVWRLRRGEIERIRFDEQLPLGMFEGTIYEPQELRLEPGDRLVVLSDGIYEAVVADSAYSTQSLHRALLSSRPLPPQEAVRALLSDLRVFLRDHELDDDAVAVFVDWNGPLPRSSAELSG